MAIKYVGPNALKKLCSLVKTALAGKINTSDIVQTTSESSSAKVPSAAVTNDLQDQVDELNTNKAGSYYADTVDEMCTIMANASTAKPCLLCISGTVSNALFGSSLMSKGYFVKHSPTQADLIMYAGVYGAGFFCRYNYVNKAAEGNVTALPTRSEIDSSFKVLTGSKSITLAAGATTGYSMTDFGMSFPTGYVCLGVIQANGDTVNVLIKGIGRVANATSNVIWLYNRSASSVTFSYGLHLLFVRSNMIG